MTSTSIYKGMDTGAKPSSRVLAPPGGGSSNIFGTTSVQAPVQKEVPAQKETPAPEPTPTQSAQSTSQAGRNIRQAPKQAYNPITGEPYETSTKKEKENVESNGDSAAEAPKEEVKENEQSPKPAAAVVKDKPSTRVAQPPGGKSSGLW